MKSRAQNRTFPPRWFDLSKYNGVEEFGPYEWYHHLLVRKACAYKFTGRIDLEGLWDSGYLPHVENMLASLRQKPLLLPKEMHRIYGAIPGDSRALPQVAGVRSMTWGDFCIRGGWIPEERHSFFTNIILAKSGPMSFSDSETDWLQEPLDLSPLNTGVAGLVVDLALPDVILVPQFLGWLKDSRASQKNRPKHYGPDFKKWGEAKLLQCVDLLLWGMQQGLTLSQAEITRALFRLEPLKADVVRKTTLPLARQFVGFASERGRSLLQRLKIEVAHESSERARAKTAKRTGKKVR